MNCVRVKVLFFGMLRDIAGISEDHLEMPEGSRLADLFERYAQRFPKLGGLASSIVLARNQHFSERGALIHEGDEIAFLPPVSGGIGLITEAHSIYVAERIEEGGHFFALTRNPIDVDAVRREMTSAAPEE